MSEEKPTFKITDRRLFNSDGSPRDIEREEEPATATASASAANVTDAGADDAGQVAAASSAPAGGASAPSSSASSSPSAPPANVASSTGAAHDEDASSRAFAAASDEDEHAAAGGDPTAFANLLMFIASPAAAAMGMTEHPGLGAGEIDLPLAKHCIDLLATLRQKTTGNLSSQEEQIIESLLAELRMQFVSLTSARPGTPGGGGRRAPRGFTGSDITGGR